MTTTWSPTSARPAASSAIASRCHSPRACDATLRGCARMPELLLKARPTPAQLADRLRSPRPDGLELYLDTADVADDDALSRSLRALERANLPAGFTLLIEGPVRSLDGVFFET